MVFKKGHKFFGDKNILKKYIKKHGVWNKGLKKGEHPSIDKIGYQKGHKINIGRKHSEESKLKNE